MTGFRFYLSTILLLIAFLPDPAHGQPACSFPAYLRARSRWEAEVSEERRAIGAFWAFNTHSLETQDLTKANSEPITYDCHRQEALDSFVVKSTNGDDKKIKYLCMKFIQRSPYVVQVMGSKTASASDTSGLCTESNLIMYTSPLIWPQPEEFIPTPELFRGGFQFTMTDHATGFDICQMASLLPLWEADCMPNDGITVDFRLIQCRGDLGMELTQKLYNLGSWKQGIYYYILATDLNELWPRIWLLRALAEPSNPNVFDIDLFRSLAVMEGKEETVVGSSSYYTIRMKRASYTSECADEALYCSKCETNSQNVNCLKTCNAAECLKLANQPPCNFPSKGQGDWSEYSNGGKRSINITAQSIVGQAQPKLSCLDLKTEVWFENVDRRTVLALYDNGCRPRYQCAEFHRRSDSVLQYQISDVTIWPQALPLNPGEICAKEKFDVIRQSIVQQALHPFRWKAIIKMNPQLLEPSSVSCGLSGRFYLMVHASNGQTCLGSIDTCKGNSNEFSYNTDGQCSGTTVGSHSCIASFKNEQNGDTVIITHSLKTTSSSVASTTVTPTENSAEYLCWVLHKGEWEPAPRLYLTHASDCHTEIANDIAYRNFTGYLAQFDMAAGPGPLGSYDCSSHGTNPFILTTTKKMVDNFAAPGVGASTDISTRSAPSLLMIVAGYGVIHVAASIFKS